MKKGGKIIRNKPTLAFEHLQEPSGGKEVLPASTVLQWFEYALKADDPKPSHAVCESFARDLRVIFNRQNNAEYETYEGIKWDSEFDKLVKIKDEDPNRILNQLLYNVKVASNALLEEIAQLENFAGNYHWGLVDGELISASELDAYIRKIALFPSPIVPENSGPAKTRPIETWTKTARSVAELIQNTLLKSGFKKKPSPKYKDGPVAIIGATAINWAYNKNISERSFADALRNRRQHKKVAPKSFEERYPEAGKIKIA